MSNLVKQTKTDNKVLSEIEKEQLFISSQIEGLRQAEAEELIQGKNNKFWEEQKYKEFVTKFKGKKYFQLSYVDELHLPYNILMISTEKNTGKTYQVYQLFKRAIAEKKKIIFIRTSEIELKNSVVEMNTDENNPVIFKTTKQGTREGIFLMDKETGDNVGRAIPLKTCNRASGGEFKDYKYIIFDEFISWEVKNIINENVLKNWEAFGSSVTRNKTEEEGATIYMFGNSGGIQDAMLNFYGINRDDKLRYIKRGTGTTECNILYIDTTKLFQSSISNQVGIAQHMGPVAKYILHNNIGTLQGINTISPTLFSELDLKAYLIFVAKNSGQLYLIEIRQSPKSDRKHYLALSIKLFSSQIPLFGKCYTDNYFISISEKDIIYSKPHYEILLNSIYLKMLANRILFYDEKSKNFSRALFDKIDKEKNFF